MVVMDVVSMVDNTMEEEKEEDGGIVLVVVEEALEETTTIIATITTKLYKPKGSVLHHLRKGNDRG